MREPATAPVAPTTAATESNVLRVSDPVLLGSFPLSTLYISPADTTAAAFPMYLTRRVGTVQKVDHYLLKEKRKKNEGYYDPLPRELETYRSWCSAV
jgi:hypothetical protein